MARIDSFSRRNRYRGAAKEITTREDAPEGLRVTVLESSRELGYGPSLLREVICGVLRVRPDSYNWSEYPNIWREVQDLMHECEWFKVYDIIEALHARFAKYDHERRGNDAASFADEINAYLIEEGIGWQLVSGQIVSRGTEAFESVVTGAVKALEDTARPTAASHLHEALQGLSRRPTADLAGTIYHAMGALEAVARDLVGDPKGTLGQVIKRNPGLMPRPLDTALSQIWGYASNEARHVREGHETSREEAELLVGLAAVMATYLNRK